MAISSLVSNSLSDNMINPLESHQASITSVLTPITMAPISSVDSSVSTACSSSVSAATISEEDSGHHHFIYPKLEKSQFLENWYMNPSNVGRASSMNLPPAHLRALKLSERSMNSLHPRETHTLGFQTVYAPPTTHCSLSPAYPALFYHHDGV
jgi:hypothetical protein